MLLEQSLRMDNLRMAWEEIAENKGIAGVNGISIRVWRRNWEERLVNLAQAVYANTYKPHKLRLRRVPKRNRRELRRLRIPTVTDRVLQRAVLQVLYPVFEPYFLDCSFGYRPGRSLYQAVQQIIVLRENGYRWVLDADIDAFFDNVDQHLLLDYLHCDLPDTSLMPLITRWLKLGSSHPRHEIGIPLGSPLSPLWANVFLHRLDVAVTGKGWNIIRYADDFLVFAANQRELQEIYQGVETILSSLNLRYEPSKTRLASFDSGFDFLGVHFTSDTYSFIFREKEIEISGDEINWLFSCYSPEYE
ncbi:MAG: reverse transcriptase domain-containing protein [Chloroflexota bacterium]